MECISKGKELFSIPCNTDIFPSRKQQLLRAIGKVKFIGKKNREIIAQFARTIPEEKTCIHGDFNMGNLIFSEDNYYWIDLDRFGYGDPMFDIGHFFQICNVFSSMEQVQVIFHMSEEQLKRFWTAFAKAYTGEENLEAFNRLAGKFACLDLGASRETIVADFDATNQVYEADVKKYTRRVKFWGGGEEEIGVVKAFLGCNTDNFVKALDRIDREYGSLDAYLKGPIGLTDDDIRVLMERYLE